MAAESTVSADGIGRRDGRLHGAGTLGEARRYRLVLLHRSHQQEWHCYGEGSYCCPHQQRACALNSRDPLPRRRYPCHRRRSPRRARPDGRGYRVGRMERQGRGGFRLVIGRWRESTPIIKYFLLSNLSAQGLLGNRACACFVHMIMPYYQRQEKSFLGLFLCVFRNFMIISRCFS